MGAPATDSHAAPAETIDTFATPTDEWSALGRAFHSGAVSLGAVAHRVAEHVSTIAAELAPIVASTPNSLPPQWPALLIGAATLYREGATHVGEVLPGWLGSWAAPRPVAERTIGYGEELGRATVERLTDPRFGGVEYHRVPAEWPRRIGGALRRDSGEVHELHRLIAAHSLFLPGTAVELTSDERGVVVGPADSRGASRVLLLSEWRDDAWVPTSPRLFPSERDVGIAIVGPVPDLGIHASDSWIPHHEEEFA